MNGEWLPPVMFVAVLLLIFVLTMHLPGIVTAGENEMQMQMSMSALLKDLALAGGALMYAHSLAKNG